jgi:hypothetical protein
MEMKRIKMIVVLLSVISLVSLTVFADSERDGGEAKIARMEELKTNMQSIKDEFIEFISTLTSEDVPIENNGSCEDLSSEGEKLIIDYRDLPFYKMCMDPKTPIPAKKTISTIFKIISAEVKGVELTCDLAANVLFHMKTISFVDKDHNPIGKVIDLRPLAGLPNLEYLSLAQTDAFDLTPVSSLTNLKTLNLWRAENIYDLTPIKRLNKLENLYLTHTSVEDLSPLKDLTSLKKIQLPNCLRDMSSLAGLTKLEEIQFGICEIESYDFLTNLVNIRELTSVPSAASADNRPFANLVNLESIWFSNFGGVQFKSIEPFAVLPKLKKLSGAAYDNLDALPEMRNLKELWIGGPIKDGGIFSELDNLIRLHIDGEITDPNFLEKLPKGIIYVSQYKNSSGTVDLKGSKYDYREKTGEYAN